MKAKYPAPSKTKAPPKESRKRKRPHIDITIPRPAYGCFYTDGEQWNIIKKYPKGSFERGEVLCRGQWYRDKISLQEVVLKKAIKLASITFTFVVRWDKYGYYIPLLKDRLKNHNMGCFDTVESDDTVVSCVVSTKVHYAMSPGIIWTPYWPMTEHSCF